MGWNDLVRALGEEVGREAAEIRARAEGDAGHAIAAALEAAEAERGRALAEARARHEAARRAALADAERARDRELLAAARAALDEVRAAALAGEIAAGLPARALDALVEEVGWRDAEWTVDPGEEAAVRERLARRDAAAAGRTEIRAAPARRGGVEVRVEQRTILDATAAARIERAWPELEPALCATLFGELHGRL